MVTCSMRHRKFLFSEKSAVKFHFEAYSKLLSCNIRCLFISFQMFFVQSFMHSTNFVHLAKAVYYFEVKMKGYVLQRQKEFGFRISLIQLLTPHPILSYLEVWHFPLYILMSFLLTFKKVIELRKQCCKKVLCQFSH